MIISIPYKSKIDGKVKLVKRISGVYAEDGKTIIPTGFKIRKVGTDEIYDEAIDVADAPYTYEETGIPIDDNTDDATEDDYQNALRDMGVQV